MNWRSLGKIFDPRDHKLPEGCVEFAQSPQALILQDRVRIYFSSRSVDPSNGKFFSRPLFADFSSDLSEVIGICDEPVLKPGELGTFDEHGIFPFSVFDDGGKITAYTCGWSRRKSVSVETATGFAESHDGGKSFKRLGTGSVFSASLHEPFLVGDSFVRKFNGVYHMWYMFGKKWIRENEKADPDRVYKIGHAVSDSGIDWKRCEADIIEGILHENECQALPTVIKIDGVYHMYFCFRDVFGFRTDPDKGYRLGHASSKDLVHWTRDDHAILLERSADGFDSHMMCYPHLFENQGHIYLLYNGNAFGRYGFGAAVLEV